MKISKATKVLNNSNARCETVYIHEEKVRRAQAHLIDGLTATHLANTFGALADPTRVRIVSALAHNELCVCDIAALLGISQSAISHQLRSLRDLRLVKFRKEGRIAFYTLDDEHIHELFDRGVKHVKHR